MRAIWMAVVAAGLIGAPALAETSKPQMVQVRSADHPPDGWLTTKVKLALFTTAGVRSMSVNVDTNDGQVTLYGKVHTAQAREAAEQAATGVSGVLGVKNLLQVVAPLQEQQVARSDQKVKEAAERALHRDPLLERSGVEVKSVDDGVVVLGGEAKNLGEQLRAIMVVDRLDGVKRVSSTIDGPDDFGYADRVFVAPSPKHRSGIDDLRVTAATKLVLLSTPDVPSTAIDVDTWDSDVTLFGVVPTAQARTAALRAAQRVAGVHKVIDELEVVPMAQQKSVAAKDSEIDHALDRSLGERKSLRDVNHTTKNGMVRLTGTVPTGWDRLNAVRIARSTEGVHGVLQDLRLSARPPGNVR